MNHKLACVLFLSIICGNLIIESEAVSCHAGRAGCIASCQAQNCATGYCTPAGKPPSQQICTCSRCAPGVPWGGH